MLTRKQKNLWKWYKKDVLHDKDYPDERTWILQLNDPRHETKVDYVDGDPYDDCEWRDHLYIDGWCNYPALFLSKEDADKELDITFSNPESDLSIYGYKREWITVRPVTEEDIIFTTDALIASRSL